MTEDPRSHLAGFFSLAVQFRRHPLIYWGDGEEGVHARGAGKQQPNLLLFPAGHTISGSPSACFIFSSLSTSSLPFSAGLFSQAPPPRLPRRSDTTGQRRVVLLRAPKFSPPQPAPPCSLSPGASLSLGCAKRPLMVRFSCRTVPRPCKVLAPQTQRVGSWHNSLWRMSAKTEPRRILNSESLRRDLKPK